MDVVSKLDGYKGAFEPILMYFYPIIILHFLIHYSNTIRAIFDYSNIRDIYNIKYKSELERTLRASFDRIKLMPDLQLKLEVNGKEAKFEALS